ncbi:MAG: DUF1439 domain-containing protein [Burkholderiaceae bacterium]|nr:DUF1439 domain-containing protein [Burkholderiaceae bacterium]
MTASNRKTRRDLCANLLKLAAIPAVAPLLVSCAGLSGPRQVEIPLEKLQAGLGKHFPVRQRALSVFDIQLANPQIKTLRENDRVALSAELTVSPILVRQSWRGSLAISGRLVVDNVRHAVFLSDAQVDRFAVDGIGESQQRQIAGAANIVADKLIRDVPVYSYKPEDLRFAGIQFVPVAIRTTSSALVLVVEPAI